MPTVIVTRPRSQAIAFLEQLKQRSPVSFHGLVAPLLRIVPLAAEIPRVADYIMTSANAVRAVSDLPDGARAWCVGARTTQAARAAGLVAINAGKDADALVSQFARNRPTGPIVHLRGTHTTGDIAARLRRAGCDVAEVIAYDQIALPLSDAARAALGSDKDVILPVFSPRSAALLAKDCPASARPHLVAISENAARAAFDMPRASLRIALAPDREAMLDAVAETLRRAE